MSKYTTEIRFICEEKAGLVESVGYTQIDTVLNTAIPKIFDFDYPIFDENYRRVLEKKILKHYYTREISEESYGLWKLRLDTKLNEIMPYYNKLYNSELLEFNPLYTVNLTRDKNTDFDSERTGSERITDSTTTSSNSQYSDSKTTESDGTLNVSSEADNSNTNWDLFSDTPQGALTRVEDGTYLTTAKKNSDEGSSTSTQDNTEHNEGTESGSGSSSSSGSVGYTRNKGDSDVLNTTEDYLEHVLGYEGSSASKLLKEYRETFLNIDMMVINDLEPLFFQLW